MIGEQDLEKLNIPSAKEVADAVRKMADKHSFPMPDEDWIKAARQTFVYEHGEPLPESEWVVWSAETYFDSSSLGAGAGDYSWGWDDDAAVKQFDDAILACESDDDLAVLADKLRAEAEDEKVILAGDLIAWLKQCRENLTEISHGDSQNRD